MLLNSEEKKPKSFFLVFLLLSFLLFGVILYLPFLHYGLPGGADTPAYFLYARITQEEGFAYMLQSDKSDRPVTLAFVTILNVFASTLNLSPPQFLLFTQLILGFLYIIAIFFIVFVATGNRWVAILSSMLAATSANTLRFQPLMANFLAFSLTIYSMAFLLKYRKSSNKYYLLLAFLFLLLGFFAHNWQAIFFTILLFSSAFLYLGLSRDEHPKSRGVIRKFATIAVVLVIVFLFSWLLLWPFNFPDLIRRFEQIWISFFTISSKTFLNFAFNWIVYETWVLKLTGLAGIFYAKTFIRNKFDLIVFYLWFTLPLLSSALQLFGGDSMRLFILTPFAVFSSFFIAHIVVIIQKSNFKSRINYRAIKLDKKTLPVLLVFAIMAVNFFEAYSWQSRQMAPTIKWHDYETLLSARKYIGNNSIILIYPAKDAGAWAEAILSSTSKRVTVYWGSLDDLWIKMGIDPIINSQLPYPVEYSKENYTVVIFDEMLYSFYLPIRQIITESYDEGVFYRYISNNSEYLFINDYLAKIRNINLAVVGSEADTAIRVVSDIDPDLGNRTQYLGNGNASLPNIEQLLKYDLMILANWNISSSDDFQKLYTYSRQRPLLALSTSAYNIFKHNSTFFEEIFGAHLAPGIFNSTYCKIVYDNSIFFTSHLSGPYIRDLQVISPVTNLTTAIGVARINDNEYFNDNEYYLLTFNQRDNLRNVIFGRSLNDMDENETFLLKKLIVWILNL